MRKYRWQLIGALFTLITGSLLHFTYDWSGRNPLVGLFSAVNESTWEHLKLLIVPMLVFSLFEFFFSGHASPCFWRNRLRAILLGAAVIVVLFYAYTGILGTNLLAADLAVFFSGVVAAWIEAARPSARSSCDRWRTLLYWLVFLLCFVLFTIDPPHIGLFRDPVTGNYGMQTALSSLFLS